jgi:exodeoxyribonuclease VII small subunit
MASFEEQLERGELTLEESVSLFEEGVRLSQACKQELDAAEGRIELLVESSTGKMQAAPMDVTEEETEDDD